MANNPDIEYETLHPTRPLQNFIHFYWHLTNKGDRDKKVMILPDGYFDIIFYSVKEAPFRALLTGISTEPVEYVIPAQSASFAISFKILAAEYILHKKMATLLNGQQKLPTGFWNITNEQCTSLQGFALAIEQSIETLFTQNTDSRKLQLSEAIYSSNGNETVQEMAAKIYWPGRQINRYLKAWLGITLKAYCTILRYRASFKNLKAGKLFPEDHFTDQAHFIKQVKKYSGVTPKALAKNENDQFIQFSTLPDK